METKKKPKFRLIVKDIDSNRVLVNTIYEDDKDYTLEKFVEKLLKKVEEI